MEASSADGQAALSSGCWVKVVGLVNRPELNGCKGQVMKWIENRGRWQVQLEGAESPLLLKSSSLEPVFNQEASSLVGADAQTLATPTIRLATSNDARNEGLVASLVQLVNDAYRSAMEGLVVDPLRFVRTDPEDIVERLEGIQHGPMRRYMVLAFVGAEVVGCSSVTTGWRHPQRGQFGMLAVKRSWQRRGIAVQLVNFAERHCMDAGMMEMQCEEMTCTDGSHETSNWMMRLYKEKLAYTVVDEYFCPRGHHTRGARTNQDLQFLIYRKSLQSMSPASHQKRPSWFR